MSQGTRIYQSVRVLARDGLVKWSKWKVKCPTCDGSGRIESTLVALTDAGRTAIAGGALEPTRDGYCVDAPKAERHRSWEERRTVEQRGYGGRIGDQD